LLDALASFFGGYNAAFISAFNSPVDGGQGRLVLFFGHGHRVIQLEFSHTPKVGHFEQDCNLTRLQEAI